MTDAVHDLCASKALADGGAAVVFDVLYQGQAERAFAIRFAGGVHAYLNRCGHVPMEMDYVKGQFFDTSGQWLMCATHGATYAPDSGQCVAGPCRRGLVKLQVSEEDGRVRWHTSDQLQPLP
jgi:nitrite reductase/ring-hydroxylating ferredoxin subunit